MTLFERLAQRHAEIDEEIEAGPENPRRAQWDLIDRLQPRITPKSEEWGATVYFDPEIFPTPPSRERIDRHYEREYPGRHFNLVEMRKFDLERGVIVKYPAAETIFRQRGFVSDIEVTAFSDGRFQPKTAYLARNIAATQQQAWVVDDLVRRHGEPTKWGQDCDIAALMGEVEGTPFPLTERDGVFLPRRQFWRQENIHFAFSQPLKHALAATKGRTFSGRYPADANFREQIEFEASHSADLFSGATPTALVFWQIQVLASLRKAAWEIDFETGTTLNSIEKEVEERKSSLLERLVTPRQSGRKPLPLYDKGPFGLALDDFEDKARDDLDDGILLRRQPNFYGIAHGIAEHCSGLTTQQNLVGALHGSTYLPEFDWDLDRDRYHPLHVLQPLALWLGDLKRSKRGVLDRRIAGLFAAIADDREAISAAEEGGEFGELVPFQDFIKDRLGAPAWQVLGERINAMLDQENAVPTPVIYEWSRDLAHPWRAEYRDGKIYIEGPLLDFPIGCAKYWSETAERILHEEQGVIRHRHYGENGDPL